MYGKNLDFEQLSIEGIRHISKIDMDYAKFLGKKIKLLGITYNIAGEIYSEVAPHMIGPENKLYNVDDVKNGIELKGNLLGDTIFYGAGAGKLPTASAVVSDIIDEAKHLHTNIPILWSDDPVVLAERGRHKSKFFIRVDRKYDEIKNTFNLEQLVTLPDYQDEYAVVTAEMTFAEFNEKIGNKANLFLSVSVKPLYKL